MARRFARGSRADARSGLSCVTTLSASSVESRDTRVAKNKRGPFYLCPDRGHGTEASTGVRIRQLEAELALLRLQQRRELLTAITLAAGRCAFSARELWQDRAATPALAAALTDAGIHSPRSLGRTLRQFSGCGLTRIGRDESGCIWLLSS